MRRIAVVLVVIVTSLSGVASTQTAWLAPQPIASPAAPNSGQPQLSVSNKGVLLSWIERTGDLATLKFAERTTTGWTPVRTIASGRNWFVNWADVPSAVRLPSGAIVAHWLQKSAESTYAYDVRLSYSTDDGRTWSPSFTPHHDGTPTEHGFASIFPIGDGFGLVWLDGRHMKAGGHGEHGGGAMTVRYARFDRNFKQVEETEVDAKVCECCPTAAATTSEGIIAAYRNRSDEEIRDNYVTRLVNGKWSAPQPVFADNWKIAACPVNGPALSARGGTVAMSWFTVKNEQGQAYLAFSQDAGKTFAAPIRLDDGGTLGRVDLELLPDNSALATWIEFADQRAQFRARRIDQTGTRSAPVTIAGIAGSRSSGYPRVAVANGEVVFAWVESGEAGALHVRTAAAPVPDASRRTSAR
ncbi:MAG TPA: sialidase family protein [Vicinamibacterales bacterium]|nr:sialidase family protein [Vicinamibacterales bacterium]